MRHWKLINNTKNNQDETSRRYSFKDHNHKTMTKLSKLWQNKQLCDVTLQIDGKDLPVHKAILVINSDYFEALYSHWYEETQDNCIKLEGLNYNAVNDIIKFMYHGTITLSTENVQDIFLASDFLQMTTIKSLCSSFMVNVIDATNCLGMMSLGEVYNCPELYDKSVKLVKLQFPVVCESPDFYNLPFDKLVNILAFDDLNLGGQSEELILKCTVKWLEKNTMSQFIDLTVLFQSVRLKSIDKTGIQDVLDNSTFFDTQDKKQIIIDLLESSSSLAERKRPESVYVIGGFLQSRTGLHCPRLKTCEKYDIQTGNWESIGDLPHLSSGAQIINLKGNILCFEQNDNGTNESGIIEYNVAQGAWKTPNLHFTSEVENLIQKCLVQEGKLVYCDQSNSLYLIYDSFIKLHVEFKDGEIFCSTFETLPQMFISGLKHFGCILCENELFVLGGDVSISQTETDIKADVCCFSHSENKWSKKSSMFEKRSMFGAVYLDGYIYAIGGFNTRRVHTVERYHLLTDQWTYIANLNKERSHLNAVVCTGKIFALGGKSYSARYGGARKVLNSCEVYDASTNTWSNIEPMKYSRCGFGAVAF